jgi:hypothetical protein
MKTPKLIRPAVLAMCPCGDVIAVPEVIRLVPGPRGALPMHAD